MRLIAWPRLHRFYFLDVSALRWCGFLQSEALQLLHRPFPTPASLHGHQSPGRECRLCVVGRNQWQRHAKGRALSWCGDKRDRSAELLRDQIVDDVEAEPGTALRA